jgi:hypothetical protein
MGALAGALAGSAVGAVAGGIALAFAVATKNEGALWCAAVTGGALLVARAAGRPVAAWLPLGLRLAAPGALVFGVWAVGRWGLGAESDLAAGLRWDAGLERLGPVATAMAGRLLENGGGWLVGGALVAIVWGVGGAPGVRLARVAALLSALGIYLAGLGAIYLTTPYDVRWHLGTSLWRTLLGVTPLLLLLAVFAPSLRQDEA